MTYCIIATPEAVCELQDVKRLILDHNVRILLGQSLYAVAQVDLKTLIGDPEHNLSEFVCEFLVEYGILSKTAVLNKNGKQQAHDSLGPVFSYAWAHEPFMAMSVPDLEALAWDLRHHSMFAHVTVVGQLVEEVIPAVAELPDVEDEDALVERDIVELYEDNVEVNRY